MIPSPADFLSHTFALNQYETGTQRELEQILLDSFKELRTMLTRSYDGLTKYQRARALTLFARTDRILENAYGAIADKARDQMVGLAKVEGKWVEKLLRELMTGVAVARETTAISATMAKSIADFPIYGVKAGEWWRKAGADVAFQVRRQIQLGLYQGEPVTKIAKRILNTDVVGEQQGVYRLARNGANTIARTSITAVTANARFETFKAQSDTITDRYVYVATLDDRTSLICISLDGTVWKYKDPKAPKPPQHPNCRSTIVAEINWKRLGIQPTQALLLRTRASMHGPVTGKTYSEWLRGQPVEVQERVLGKSRARLFRDGISVKEMLRRDGTPLTLDALAKKLNVDIAT